MNSMDSKSFLKGVGMGMAIGASMGMLMAPRKKGDNVIGRALKAAGERRQHHGSPEMNPSAPEHRGGKFFASPP